VLTTRIVAGVEPSEGTPRQVEAEFRRLLDDGVRLAPVGDARDDPELLLSGRPPRHKIALFDATFYLTNPRFDDDLGFFVAYVRLGSKPREIRPRIFYKDVSLVWRSATHCISTHGDNWIGKGDLKSVMIAGEEIEYGAEETTNLPLEIQCALDTVSRRVRRPRRDDEAIFLVLRNAPDGRFEPYRDFSEPRRRAMADPRNLVNGGESIAWFERERDPASLRFVPGFEPDFADGILEMGSSGSRLYGGRIDKHRVLSRNRSIQYQFLAAPRHVWIVPPQTLTTELSSYGVRTVDVHADEDLCVPGYEYHFMDEGELHSQIPEGFAGPPSEIDPSRCDASPWLEKLPVIQEFKRKVLKRR
jgi:hypothetical protein